MRLLLLAICLLVEALAFSQGFNRKYDFLGLGTAQTALNIELLADGYLTIGGGTDYDSIAPGEFFVHGSVHQTASAVMEEFFGNGEPLDPIIPRYPV
jgi:hypothetical protein